MLAECSLYPSQSAGEAIEYLRVTEARANLTILALPHEVGVAAAAGLGVLFLCDLQSGRMPHSDVRRAYMAAHGDPVGVDLATGGALHFKGVVERVVFVVDGLEVGHAGKPSDLLVCH